MLRWTVSTIERLPLDAHHTGLGEAEFSMRQAVRDAAAAFGAMLVPVFGRADPRALIADALAQSARHRYPPVAPRALRILDSADHVAAILTVAEQMAPGAPCPRRVRPVARGPAAAAAFGGALGAHRRRQCVCAGRPDGLTTALQQSDRAGPVPSSIEPRAAARTRAAGGHAGPLLGRTSATTSSAANRRSVPGVAARTKSMPSSAACPAPRCRGPTPPRGGRRRSPPGTRSPARYRRGEGVRWSQMSGSSHGTWAGPDRDCHTRSKSSKPAPRATSRAASATCRL